MLPTSPLSLPRGLAFGCLLVLAVLPVRAERVISFSGYDWTVRHTDTPQGPGPNRFSDHTDAVRIAEDGALHLRIRREARLWHAAEVRLREALGYGTYIFQTDGDLRFTSPWVILGLFTFDHDAPELDYREIDIEFGRFGNPDKPDGQFALHPFQLPGHRAEFMLPRDPPPIQTHGFHWQPGRIDFRSASGSHPDLFALPDAHPDLTATWRIQGDTVPDPGNARVHINLWLYRSRSPRTDHTAVIRSFTFTPSVYSQQPSSSRATP